MRAAYAAEFGLRNAPLSAETAPIRRSYFSGSTRCGGPTPINAHSDNRVLECALAGRADAIVTGDSALLELGEFRGVRVISLREYLGG